jgi:hypothetical protein
MFYNEMMQQVGQDYKYIIQGTALLYKYHITDWRGEGREERGANPLAIFRRLHV